LRNQPTLFHYLELHFIVLLYGFTAILGKLISIPAIELVSYRMSLASMALFVLLLFQKKSFRIAKKDTLFIMGVGLVVAAHWIFFFGAVKVSNVAVTLGVMASGTLFTSFLEPLVEKRSIYWVEVFIGVVIMIGLYVISRFAMEYWLGIVYALISSFLAVVFTVLNQRLTRRYDAVTISFYEMLTGFCGIMVFLYLSGTSITPIQELERLDFLWIPILAIFCTAYAFAGVVRLMRHVTAYTVSLSINLEPVYGIILAFFIFGESEKMNLGFYSGAIILLLAIFGYPYLKKRFHVGDE